MGGVHREVEEGLDYLRDAWYQQAAACSFVYNVYTSSDTRSRMTLSYVVCQADIITSLGTFRLMACAKVRKSQLSYEGELTSLI